jgi:hypothetical protein
MKVAILGCGPAGLIAAHSAATVGHDVVIYSRKRRSITFGAMYLHAPIPDISPDNPEMMIDVNKVGTRWGYAESVYGDPNAEVSWDKFTIGPTPGWDLKSAYSKLWRQYNKLIVDVQVTPESVEGIKADMVFSAIPARSICLDWQHRFDAVNIVVLHGPTTVEENIMVYNGVDLVGMPAWYRYSRIRGYQSWEFSEDHAPTNISTSVLAEGVRVSKGIKPLRTTCTCHPNVVRIGRFGKWDRHAFTHHGYEEVRSALQQV